ncbi:MAG: sensor histidine kinase [Bacillota bacterium]
MLEIKTLDEIIKDTIDLIEKSKEEIYNIAEAAEAETERMRQEVESIREETQDIIAKVDSLQAAERKARIRLMEVSSDFKNFSESDIKEAYETAQQLQIELITLRSQENVLRIRRDELERGLKRQLVTKKRAERLASQVGVILQYLQSDLQDAADRIGEMHQWQEMALRILEAQEEERRRVAREIHDGPAQSMANVVMRAEFCLRLLEKDPSKLQEELQALQVIVRDSLQDTRKIIFDLRPMALDDIGLPAALKKFVSNYKEQYGLPVEFHYYGPQKRLPAAVEVALFRIVQEGLNNIYKHADATNVQVKLEVTPDKVNLVVRDNGKGFNAQKILKDMRRKGYGLIGVKERVQLLKGEMNIDSSPGSGTTLVVRFDITEN